jgi:hypothetical protein
MLTVLIVRPYLPRATILSVPSGRGRCSFKASSDGAVIQVSTSADVVRITGHCLWVDGANLRIRLSREEREQVVDRFAFLHFPYMSAKCFL